MTRSGGRNSLAPFAVKNNRKGNTKFFARLNDLQIGQAKTTKKLNELRNPMGISHVLQAAPAGKIIYTHLQKAPVTKTKRSCTVISIPPSGSIGIDAITAGEKSAGQ